MCTSAAVAQKEWHIHGRRGAICLLRTGKLGYDIRGVKEQNVCFAVEQHRDASVVCIEYHSSDVIGLIGGVGGLPKPSWSCRESTVRYVRPVLQRPKSVPSCARPFHGHNTHHTTFCQSGVVEVYEYRIPGTCEVNRVVFRVVLREQNCACVCASGKQNACHCLALGIENFPVLRIQVLPPQGQKQLVCVFSCFSCA